MQRVSAKSRSPTAVHFERLLHAVCRDKGPIQIVPSNYDKVCSYSHKQLLSALLVLSDTSCVDSDSISLPRSTLLCHYLENIVYSALPQWLSQSTLLCLKEWLQLSVKEDLCILPASKVQPSNSPSCYCKSSSCNLSATIDCCNNHALIRLLGSAATQKRVVAVAVQALLSHNWLAKKIVVGNT